MIQAIKNIVDKNNGYLEIGDVFIADGVDENGMPCGEFFELLAIEKKDNSYICIMDCYDNEEWLLDDMDEESLNVILTEIE